MTFSPEPACGVIYTGFLSSDGKLLCCATFQLKLLSPQGASEETEALSELQERTGNFTARRLSLIQKAGPVRGSLCESVSLLTRLGKCEIQHDHLLSASAG